MEGKKLIVDLAVAIADGYEKLKACLPEELKNGLDDFEADIVDIGKEIALELMKRKTGSAGPEETKKAKKVDISFGGENGK